MYIFEIGVPEQLKKAQFLLSQQLLWASEQPYCLRLNQFQTRRAKYCYIIIVGVPLWLNGKYLNLTYIFLKLCYQILQQFVVKVLSSEVSVTICGFDFKHSFLDFQNRHIKCTTSQIIYCQTAIKKMVLSIFLTFFLLEFFPITVP